MEIEVKKDPGKIVLEARIRGDVLGRYVLKVADRQVEGVIISELPNAGIPRMLIYNATQAIQSIAQEYGSDLTHNVCLCDGGVKLMGIYRDAGYDLRKVSTGAPILLYKRFLGN